MAAAAVRAPGGEECRCTVYLFRAEYYGHDVIVDFREFTCAAGTARDSSFERSLASRPKASLVSSLVVVVETSTAAFSPRHVKFVQDKIYTLTNCIEIFHVFFRRF